MVPLVGPTELCTCCGNHFSRAVFDLEHRERGVVHVTVPKCRGCSSRITDHGPTGQPPPPPPGSLVCVSCPLYGRCNLHPCGPNLGSILSPDHPSRPLKRTAADPHPTPTSIRPLHCTHTRKRTSGVFCTRQHPSPPTLPPFGLACLLSLTLSPEEHAPAGTTYTAMSILRPFDATDVLRFHSVNADLWTATYHNGYYASYLAQWPDWCIAAQPAFGDSVGAYSESCGVLCSVVLPARADHGVFFRRRRPPPLPCSPSHPPSQ